MAPRHYYNRNRPYPLQVQRISRNALVSIFIVSFFLKLTLIFQFNDDYDSPMFVTTTHHNASHEDGHSSLPP